MTFRAERARPADDGPARWVVIDGDWSLHREACAFLEALRAADRSPNTERVYAGRVALFLNWSSDSGVNWTQPTFLQLHGFLRWLATSPYATRNLTGVLRVRSKSTANAVFTTVSEFLRFGATQGWVPRSVPAMITTQKYLRFAPAGFDVGEQDHAGRHHQPQEEPVPVVRHAAQQSVYLRRAEIFRCPAGFAVLDRPGLNVPELQAPDHRSNRAGARRLAASPGRADHRGHQGPLPVPGPHPGCSGPVLHAAKSDRRDPDLGPRTHS